jgi:transposase
LFAALEVATGKVIGQTHGRHRNEEFRRFLNVIDMEVPQHLDVHLILDNYSTHKADEVQRWQLRHPRFYFHFVPTHASWLNLIERWFAECAAWRPPPAPSSGCGGLAHSCYAFLTDREGEMLELEADHRRHAVVENVIRDLKYGLALNHMPSGKFGANAVWLALNVIAHNLCRWLGRPDRE